MVDRLFVGILGHRHAGKSFTWKTLFNKDTGVRTGERSRLLKLRPGKCVNVFVVSGSPQERKKYTEDILKNQRARIVLCSIQYVEEAADTINYILNQGFWTHIQWLNPGYRDDERYPDYLGLGNRLMFSGATISIRSGQDDATSRVQELRELIYGWAECRRLIIDCD